MRPLKLEKTLAVLSYLPQNAYPGSLCKPRVRPRYRDSSRETEMLDVWREVQLDGGNFYFRRAE